MKNLLSPLFVSVLFIGCDTKNKNTSRYHIDETVEKDQTF